MRIIFNALSSYRRRTGVGSYVAHLGAELKKLAGDAMTAFPEGWMAPVATLAGRMLGGRAAATNSDSHRSPRSLTTLTGQLRGMVRTGIKDFCERSFRRACRLGGFDLYHEPNFIPWDCDLPTVVTVHDLSVILHPEWHPRDRVEFHEQHFAAALARCCHVLTVSEWVQYEIITAMGLPSHKISAVPNGVRSDMRPMTPAEFGPVLNRRRLRPGYLLYVGSIEPRKNILMLMRSYCSLEPALRSRHALVLAGPWGWDYTRERDYYECEARHLGVRHVGYVADADLPALYNGAAALVYPSYYEGFGLPPVEMMACGGAVLASTAGAVREVCGRHAQFTEPDDAEGWRDAMRRALTDPEWLAELQRGAAEHARQFSWQRTAKATWAVYQNVTDQRTVARAA